MLQILRQGLSADDTTRIGGKMNWGGLQSPQTIRWVVAYGLFGAPRAGASIAFALAALSITESPASGATALAAMTAAQLVGALPIARLGRGANSIAFFKALIFIRTAALFVCATACGVGAPYAVFIAAAVAAGLVQGAAFGYLRDSANYLIVHSQMTRALALAAFASDLTFLVTPILAASLGSVSASFSIAAIAILGAVPAMILPSARSNVEPQAVETRTRSLTPEVLLWLGCACASSAAISGIEVGAVSLAMGFDLQAGYGAIFTGTLCAASLVGSMGNGVLNKAYSKQQVAAMFITIIIGMALILQNSFGLSILGCALVGICAPSLGIHYSLQLNRLVAPEMRAEVFSVLKISTSLGTILASATLGWTSVTFALTTSIWMLAGALAAILSKDFILGRRLTEARLSGGATGLATAPALTAGRRSERNDR
ncbi:MFS transporter [Rhizobium grahamii]|uniref:MFS transporter n=1 Tax=Rhizobium grahamii TaxID=1120045 RepID=A0A5Q0C1Z8_9HYPH|nr:MFS transporter [Rhizobium grahamii]QRM50984.1 MFS transporter [Rhizobium sp. BG6]